MSWKEEWEDCCGTCKHHHTDDEGTWVCTEQESDCYGCETRYDDGPCIVYESRGIKEKKYFNDL